MNRRLTLSAMASALLFTAGLTMHLDVRAQAAYPIKPDAVVKSLATAIQKALQRPDVQQRMNNLDLNFEVITGAATAKRLADVSARYARVIQATGMKVE